MYCRNCGSKLKENAKFCGECGWKIEDVTESEIISDEERPQKKKGVKKIILPVILMVILFISVVVVIYLKQQSTKENLLGNTSSQNLATFLISSLTCSGSIKICASSWVKVLTLISP